MDFETMIREAQKNGLTIDDIAKQFSKTLNAVEQENQRKKTIKDSRTRLLEEMEDAFANTEEYEVIDAIALYAITMAKEHPEWSAEDIKEFYETIKITGNTAAALTGKSIGEKMRFLLDKTFELAPKKVPAKSDDEKIMDFLRELGL